MRIGIQTTKRHAVQHRSHWIAAHRVEPNVLRCKAAVVFDISRAKLVTLAISAVPAQSHRFGLILLGEPRPQKSTQALHATARTTPGPEKDTDGASITTEPSEFTVMRIDPAAGTGRT